MTSKIDIVCLKWGTKFSVDYVNNLYSGIARNTSVDFTFHCFTENSDGILDGIVVHDLPNNNLSGWWNKLWLFSEELPLPEGSRVMFFDLDTIVTGNIDDILNYGCPQDMVGLVNFYYPPGFASGLMMWKHGTQTHIWERFKQNPSSAIAVSPDGDQEWTARNLTQYEQWQNLFPNRIYSYKKSCSTGLPEDARIVCYHGTPSIIESFTKTVRNSNGVWEPQEWVKEYWRS